MNTSRSVARSVLEIRICVDVQLWRSWQILLPRICTALSTFRVGGLSLCCIILEKENF